MRVTDMVESILANSSQARNSDKELQIIYMYKVGMNLTSEQVRKFREMPSFETIRRIRQKIQSSGKYPANENVKRERKHKAMVMEQASPVYRPKHIEGTLEQQVPMFPRPRRIT